jgi:small GTP-binding protein
VEDLRSDPAVDGRLKQELDPLVRRVASKRENQQLEIVAFGTVSGGKSTLLNVLAGREVFPTDARGGTTVRRNEIPWPGMDKVTLVDTPGLGEVGGQENLAVSAAAARDADLVLMVVDGPLRQSEFQLLKQLSEMEKRVLLCLNKRDWYNEQEQAALLRQIAEQVKDWTSADDVIAVEARPSQRTRVRLSADGARCEEFVERPADIAPLAERMMKLIRQDGHDLLLANLLLQSRGLVEEARGRVRQSLDRRAWQIVDRYAWGAGGAAALSPLPVLDLAAGAAVSTKMVLDLARVYRQDVDLNTVIHLLGQLGKNLIAILGVSAAGPAVTSAVASLLKTVPGIGTIAGGVLQGLVQALVTRWIGSVFIEYYKSEMLQPDGGLAALARRQWDRMTSASELYKLAQAARSHWSQSKEQESQP